MSAEGFPIGAIVLLDGRYRVRVRGYWPEGSSFYPWPHYRIAELSGGESSTVQVNRIGIKEKP